MKTTSNVQGYPDLNTQPTEHIFGAHWDTVAVARIIRRNSESGKSPAYLYLGGKEAELLRKHLASAFGEECVATLHDTYYMGLKVVIVDAQQYICTGGSKETLTLQASDLRFAS
ncbi:MAG: hypothetical protein ACSHX9_11185 [Luteolibacter sp.]